MNFEHTEVMNLEGAFRGMRNPMKSWDRSDSYFELVNLDRIYLEDSTTTAKETLMQDPNYMNKKIIKANIKAGVAEIADIGPKDMALAQRLVRSGSEHCKFLRQIFVSVDITAPIYWYKELDTYKVGTTANSTSTMHTLATTEITHDCFETDDYKHNLIIHYDEDGATGADIPCDVHSESTDIIEFLETLRQKYLETNDTVYWKELIRWLPESWLQTRTWTCNYAVLRNICQQRKNHKLTEWHQFIKWVETLPYAQELILLE